MNGKKIMNGDDDRGWPALIAMVVLALLVFGIAKIILAEARPSNALSEEQADYQRAVNLAVWPNPATVAHNLVQLKPADTLVTWTCAACVDYFKRPQLTKLTWVTVQDHLQQFCRQFVKVNGSDPDQLDLRLKQRLGLPPDATYDTFVEFTVAADDAKKIFRPCGDWDPSTSTCNAVKGSDVWNSNSSIKPEALDWLVKNHYSSYATDHPYPWTALGYTFDWARNDDAGEDADADFVRQGESEFVVPANVAIQFVSSATTADYCKAP